MSWGTITLGTLVLSETHTIEDKINANDGVRSIVLAGQEMTFGALTLEQLRAKAEDLVLLMDRVLPVVFSRKTDRNGYYRVVDAGTSSTHWVNEGSFFTWNLSLSLVGSDNVVDVESRMTHVVRANDFSLTGQRWHAPEIGAIGYATGTSVPSSVARVGEEGTVTTYVSIPAVNPRWASPVTSHMLGRARVVVNGIDRMGTRLKMSASDTWVISNSLVKVTWTSGNLRVSSWDSTASTWRNKDWGIFTSSAVQVSAWNQVTVTRNRPDLVSIRLVCAVPTGGVFYLDLMLRRGSRFVEGYMQRSSSADSLTIRLASSEAYTSNTGYIVATAADANGIKYAAGSARSFTVHANGGVVKASTRTLDFWVGAVPAGAGSGDLAADLAQQYITVPNEQTGVVVR